MNLKDWFLFEEKDVAQRLKSYSGYRLIFFLTVILGFGWSIFWLWEKANSPLISLLDNFIISQTADLRSTFLQTFFAGITFLGNGYFIAFLSLILVLALALNKRKRAAFVTLFSLSGSYVLVLLLKNFFGRERPFGCLDFNDCLSFPSGHTTLAYYFYGLLDYLAFKFLPISLKSILMISVFVGLLIILIAVSRVVLRVHYPSDLLGGFFLGNAWLLLSIFLIDLLYKK